MKTSAEIVQKLKRALGLRKDYLRKNGLEAFRWVHGEGDGLPGLSVDVYGPDLFVIFREAFWLDRREVLREGLLSLHPNAEGAAPRIFFATNFPGKAPVKAPSEKEVKIASVKEGDLAFEIHLGEGLHTGLFLDQRENRRRVRAASRNKKVLNLFSYTGAFSVAALKGEASEVVSVDLSKGALQWLERNVSLNDLDRTRSHTHVMDVNEFLKKAKKREEKFDLLILDPPTFSRGSKKTFSTEKDLQNLVASSAQVLKPQGQMFISINTRNLNPQQFHEKIRGAVDPWGLKIRESFPLPPDFPLTPLEKKNPHLKSCRVG